MFYRLMASMIACFLPSGLMDRAFMVPTLIALKGSGLAQLLGLFKAVLVLTEI